MTSKDEQSEKVALVVLLCIYRISISLAANVALAPVIVKLNDVWLPAVVTTAAEPTKVPTKALVYVLPDVAEYLYRLTLTVMVDVLV